MTRTAAQIRHNNSVGQCAFGIRKQDSRVVIPADIEVRAEHGPCWNCESRGPCRHRPWMARELELT